MRTREIETLRKRQTERKIDGEDGEVGNDKDHTIPNLSTFSIQNIQIQIG